MFGGLGDFAPEDMPAFTFGSGEAGLDLSAAGLFGGDGFGYNPTTPTPAGVSGISSSNNSHAKSKSAKECQKKVEAVSKSSPTQVDEVPQGGVPTAPTTPDVGPVGFPELLDGSTSEDANHFGSDDDDDEASLTSKDAANAGVEDGEGKENTPVIVSPNDAG